MQDRAKSIAFRIKKAREALGINQATVCKDLDIKQNRWSQYESGERPITIEVATKLADIYGIGLDWTYRGDPNDLPSEIRPAVMRAMRPDQLRQLRTG